MIVKNMFAAVLISLLASPVVCAVIDTYSLFFTGNILTGISWVEMGGWRLFFLFFYTVAVVPVVGFISHVFWGR